LSWELKCTGASPKVERSERSAGVVAQAIEPLDDVPNVLVSLRMLHPLARETVMVALNSACVTVSATLGVHPVSDSVKVIFSEVIADRRICERRIESHLSGDARKGDGRRGGVDQPAGCTDCAHRDGNRRDRDRQWDRKEHPSDSASPHGCHTAFLPGARAVLAESPDHGSRLTLGPNN
jgi:hypothetical protein